MARTKQRTPRRVSPARSEHDFISDIADSVAHRAEEAADHGSSIIQLIICAGGIYASFIVWGLLQERITTTPYGDDKKIWKYSLVTNTVQSLFSALVGWIYFRYSTLTHGAPTAVFPSRSIVAKLLVVAITQNVSSSIGYSALAHINYVTYLLAKSCKLLPVMLLQITLFQKKYPLSKYLVILAVTAGVTVFTLYPSNPKKLQKKSTIDEEERNVVYGMSLLGVNLLFDGLYNTIQDDIFAKSPKGSVSGPQMMAALNSISACLTAAYLLLNPWSVELSGAWAFMKEHPKVVTDILAFGVCGAVGQVFIFHTLAKFGSLVLVTTTITRKMLSMVCSIVAFGHSMTRMQGFGVMLVFGGIGAETLIKMREDKKKKKEARLNGIANGAVVNGNGNSHVKKE